MPGLKELQHVYLGGSFYNIALEKHDGLQ